MKICFICGEYPPGPHGGIGTMTQILGRSLTRLGHDVRVIGVYPRSYPAPNFEVDEGVRIWRLRDYPTTGNWIFSRRQLFKQVEKWVLADDVDVVEVPDYQGWAAGWGKLNAPVIGRLHGSVTYFAAELGRAIDRLSFWLERSSVRRFDYICSVSEYTSQKTQQVFKLNRRKSHTILYNPVEMVSESSFVPRSENRVVFSGTLTGKKGIVSLIEAWPTVVNSYPDAELHVFGKDGRTEDGESMQEFLSARLNGTSASVRFHGHVSREKLFEALCTACAAVFPSYAEAFAIAPLEAMACGCPTIYSRQGSGPEMMEDGRDGLLIDPHQPRQIADAILNILSNPTFARQIGDSGRNRIREQFSIASLVNQNIDFYQECIKEFGLRHRKAIPAG
jgi:glycosyltransferase involved in cell wall biosynthesis